MNQRSRRPSPCRGRKDLAARALAALALLVASSAVASSAAIAAEPEHAGQAVEPRRPGVRIEYRKPENPEHEPLYREMRDGGLLDHLAECLSVVRIPRTLTLAFAGCDGDSNAYYDARTATVTFCYEYLADIHDAAAAKRPKNLRDAIEGPVAFVLLHETGHAVFDLLKVPILGRAEDAADAFAAMHLLRMEKDDALRLIEGAAWAYGNEVRATELDESDLSDIHSLDAQRYYNLLCLAYGSDPKYFRAAVAGGKLPEQRVSECPAEYRQVAYAIKTLIAPSIDQAQTVPDRTKHSAHWNH